MDAEFVPALKWTEIPPIFWSDLTNEPFQKCISCECSLLDNEVEYLIEKAFQTTAQEGIVSTLFEYAICFPCAGQMRAKMSQSSLARIAEFQSQQVDMDERRAAFLQKESKIEDWLKECIFHRSPPTAKGEYQIYGQCVGNQFLYYDMPFMISGEALDEMMDLISNETLDELNNFKDDITSGPPEFQELLEKGPRVFI